MRTGVFFAAGLVAGVCLCSAYLAAPALVAAQEVPRPAVRGLFGDRVLGQPLQPKASTRFGTVNQRGLLGSPTQTPTAGGAMFATPWRRGEPASLQMLWGAPLQFGQTEPSAVAPGQPQPPAVPTAQPQAGQPFQYGQMSQEMQSSQQTPSRGQQQQPQEGDTGLGLPGPEGVGAPGAEAAFAGAGPSPGAASAVVRPLITGWAIAGDLAGRPASPTAHSAPRPARAPELSAKITRLARAGGVQSPTGIEVTLVGTTAVLHGTVGSEHHRTLVANLLRLEPGVWQVENKLAVAASPQP